MNPLIATIFASFDWFMRIVKLNLVWLLASFAGLFVISFFPATMAAFTVTTEWTKGNVDIPVWKTFSKAFKDGFIRAQLIGYLLLLAFVIIYVDFQFFNNFDGVVIKYILLFILLFMLLGLVTISLYIFPILVENKLTLIASMKNALFTGLSFIYWTIINLLGVVGILFVTYRFPATFIFLTGGGIILWLTCIAVIVKNKIETKYEKLNIEIN